MSGVKGENSLKLFGNDFEELTRIESDRGDHAWGAGYYRRRRLRRDRATQPAVSIDRTKAARYGLQPRTQQHVQAAVGGAPVTTIIEGDRSFDFTVRYPGVPRYA